MTQPVIQILSIFDRNTRSPTSAGIHVPRLNGAPSLPVKLMAGGKLSLGQNWEVHPVKSNFNNNHRYSWWV